MKKYILFAFSAIVLLTTAAQCNQIEEPTLEEQIIGTWTLSGATFTKSAKIGSETIDVEITFNQDYTFTMSQIIGRGRASEFSGKWSLQETIMSGTYSDGSEWGSRYEISFVDGLMNMTSITGGDIYTYSKK